MRLKFLTNDYLLTWNLLYGSSFSEVVHTFKQKLYKTYSRQYINLERDKKEMLLDIKNFIPDDDTIYNMIFNTEEFKIVKRQTDKYRRFLMRIWDTHQKEIQNSLKELLRFKVENKYQILVVHPFLDNVEFLKTNPKKNVVWGKKEDTQDGLKAIIRILFTLVKYEVGDFQSQNKEIVSSIIDLLVTNEIYTRITGVSKYEEGLKKLKFLKRQIYPYWLMYMGADREELVSYMMRDQMPFDIDKYPVEKGLRKVDLFGFIDFCCKNQKYIIRLSNLETI